MEKRTFRATLGTFNLAKGFAMICVVVGHSLQHYSIGKWSIITPFLLPLVFGNALMPMFFLISGFGFRPKSAKAVLQRTTDELIKPYVVVMCAIALLFPVVHYLTFRWWPGAFQEATRYLLSFLFGVPSSGKVLFGYSLYECAVVWFLLAMFTAMNLLNVIINVKRRAVQILLVVLCILASQGLYALDFNYYCLPQGLAATGFCYIGYIIREYKLLDRLYASKRRFVIYLLLLLITIRHIVVYGRFDLTCETYDDYLIEYFGALCSGVLLLCLLVRATQLDWNQLDGIKTIGTHSYWILCLHSVEHSCIPWYYWSEIMSNHQILGFLGELMVKTLIFTVGCWILKRRAQYKYLKRKQKYFANRQV